MIVLVFQRAVNFFMLFCPMRAPKKGVLTMFWPSARPWGTGLACRLGRRWTVATGDQRPCP